MFWPSDDANEESCTYKDEIDEEKDTCIELLENIASEQRFEVTFVDIEEISKKVVHHDILINKLKWFRFLFRRKQWFLIVKQ